MRPRSGFGSLIEHAAFVAPKETAIPLSPSRFDLGATLSLLLVATAPVGCASRSSVRDELRERAAELPRATRTSVLILVDGLSTSLLASSLRDGQAPNAVAFFGSANGNLQPAAQTAVQPATGGPALLEIPLGRASFPTLTYPNLASILTGDPMRVHGVVGNHVLAANGEVLDFENHSYWPDLRRHLRAPLVFDRLARQGEPSVSLSYPFGFGSTARLRKSLEAGAAYVGGDYREIDLQTLTELRELLRETPARWPRFIFVHLIGVDGYSHRFGPGSAEARDHWRELDSKLAFVFARLRAADALGHPTQAALTSDHGFASSRNAVDLKSSLQGLRTLIDNRAVTAYVRADRNQSKSDEAKAAAAAQAASTIAGVELSAARTADGIEIFARGRRIGRIEADPRRACPSGLPSVRQALEGRQPMPFVCDEDEFGADLNSATAVSLRDRFQAPDRPDLIAVAAPGWDFASGHRGNHGGLTPEELFVPLLTWNVAPTPTGAATRSLLPRMGLIKAEPRP